MANRRFVLTLLLSGHSAGLLREPTIEHEKGLVKTIVRTT